MPRAANSRMMTVKEVADASRCHASSCYADCQTAIVRRCRMTPAHGIARACFEAVPLGGEE